MERNALEVSGDGAELRASGEILTDKLAMERIVSEELMKIVNEQLIPFRADLRRAQRDGLTSLIASVIIYSLGLFFFYMKYKFFVACLTIVGVIPVSAFFLMLREVLYWHHKLFQAINFFERVMDELNDDAINGRVELNSLRTAFPLKAELIIQREEKEKEEYNKMAKRVGRYNC